MSIKDSVHTKQMHKHNIHEKILKTLKFKIKVAFK